MAKFIVFVQIQDIAENDNPWVVFVETTDPEKPHAKLPYFEKDSKYAVLMCVLCVHVCRVYAHRVYHCSA